MRKIFMLAFIGIFCIASIAFTDVVQDSEVHKVIGGLYSLAASVSINGSNTSHINQLRQYFTGLPDDWHNQVQLSRVHNSMWAGIAVDKYSSARRFLRSHAQELGITEAPEGYTWLGGDFAWLNLSGLRLKAAKGSGKDSGVIFLSADGNSWFMSPYDFTKEALREIMRRFGVKKAPELHRPSAVRQSIYESVKPSDVRRPENMHVGRKRSSFDMEIEMGKDVIFDPIPNRPRNR